MRLKWTSPLIGAPYLAVPQVGETPRTTSITALKPVRPLGVMCVATLSHQPDRQLVRFGSGWRRVSLIGGIDQLCFGFLVAPLK